MIGIICIRNASDNEKETRTKSFRRSVRYKPQNLHLSIGFFKPDSLQPSWFQTNAVYPLASNTTVTILWMKTTVMCIYKIKNSYYFISNSWLHKTINKIELHTNKASKWNNLSALLKSYGNYKNFTKILGVSYLTDVYGKYDWECWL